MPPSGWRRRSAFGRRPLTCDQDTQILRRSPSRRSHGCPDQVLQEQARFLLFSTTDLWRHGGFTHAGVLWAPSGLDRDGPVLKLMFGGGIYHYLSGALGNADVLGRQLAGDGAARLALRSRRPRPSRCSSASTSSSIA